MGMTLWIHTLEGRNYSKDSDDHPHMHDFSDQLDQICDQLHVQKVSDLIDYTDTEFNYRDQDDDDDSDEDREPELDPETDLAYGIDDMQWFDATDGLATLQALRNYAAETEIADMDDDEKAELIEELDDCIDILEDTASRKGLFHFSLIE